MPLSRRTFIHLVGRAGGVAAVYRTMTAMGLLATPAAYAGPPALAPGRGTRVIILGAGIAGMVAAYELRKAGYACTVLEARARPGGRCWTLRDSVVVEETDATQRASWDAGAHMYFDAGPARLPYHHEGILGYCRELDVPVEVVSNDNRGAYLHDAHAFGGKPVRARAVISDMRGFVAELAAKALDQGALGRPFTAEDAERVRAFLKEFGALDQDLVYRGTARAGFLDAPTYARPGGVVARPMDVREILSSSFWERPTQFAEEWNHAPTMLQAVGGMDRIAQAFARSLGPVIRHGAEVTQIRKTGSGARVVWRDAKGGASHDMEAPFVICTLPFSVLRGIDADLSAEMKKAVAAVEYVPAVKIAFQAERRFWELDDHIYGGVSWTDRDISQIQYPSHGLHQPKGILVGGYIWTSALGESFSQKPPAERLEVALECGEMLHPGYGRQVGRGVSVAWSKIPWSAGAWAEWSVMQRRDFHFALSSPDGPIHFAGEHLSPLPGWLEGAVVSAHHAVAEVAKRAAKPS